MSLIYPNEDYVSQQRSQANYILDNYRFEKSIGQGTFGKVKLALILPSNKKYAVKILNKTQIKLKKETHLVKRELDIIPKFAHPNVIHVKCIFEDENNYYIIMDYCENGELFDYIVKHHSLTEDETALFFYQLINGVEHIHSKHVVHRDLKPENLLLTKSNMLKIIDFGLSNHFSGNESKLLETKCGSPSYAAPEIIKGFPYDGRKTDVWCCGIITYAMICGYLPFEGEENKEIFDNVLKGVITFPENVPEHIEYIIREMLIEEPNERIVIADIKRSSLYLQGKKIFSTLYGNQTIPTFNINKDRKIALTTPNSDHGDEQEDNNNNVHTHHNSKAKETIVLASNGKGRNNDIYATNATANIKQVKNAFRKKILQLTTNHNPSKHVSIRTDVNLNTNANNNHHIYHHDRFSPITQHVNNKNNNNIITMKKLFAHNNTKNTNVRHHNHNNIHNYNQHHITLSKVTTPNITPTTTVSNIHSISNIMVVPQFKTKNVELKYDTHNPIKNKLNAFYLYKQSNVKNHFLSPPKLITMTNTRGVKSVRRESEVLSTEPNPMFPRFVNTTRKMKSSAKTNSNKLHSDIDNIIMNNNNNSKGMYITRNNNNLYMYNKYNNSNSKVSKERNNSQDGRNCSTVGNMRVYVNNGNGYLPKLI